MVRFTAAISLIALAATSAAAQNAPAPAPAPAQNAAQNNALINAELPADQAALKSHIMFLASDQMRGREAGSAEYDIAAQYVASQFYEQGLRPAGDDGSYLQKVPLLSYKPADKGSMAIAAKGGQPASLIFGEDYVPAANPAKLDYSVTAPVVFVGQGIVGLGRDDYKGINVKGKIVAFFGGAPSSFPAEERAHFSSPSTKAEIAMKKGAVGYVTLESPLAGRGNYPFKLVAANYDRARVTWAEADGSGHIPTPAAPGLGMLSLAGATKLFAGAKTPWATIAEAAKQDGATFKPMALPATLSVTLKTATSPITSYNVAGMLPGSDPALGKEVVVLSAHLDHVGVGKADAKGDTIYNGAMDNAVGIASLIEEARRFKASGKPPRRSVLFLAVTAEEKGLVGSDYFAHNPTVAKQDIVADVNLDMPIINYKFEDVTPFGAAHSTLGETVARAAAQIGVGVGGDPRPDEAFFVRSDHYRFVQQGIPSVFLWPGEKGPGKAATDAFLSSHYHQPSDDLVQQPAIDWESGARFVDVNYRIAREIADADQKPMWKKGDFFGTAFGGPMEK
ncbi:Zn-dependent M28 family amino/carboxypeptidase [Sphingomonas naasensis]|uniref:M20/M25/M40 family metallo-hydrolase n=1 Tax=Sphingomonas naasensis TaxID=1344951 RepID=A0A4S1WGR8_9SPHN|nr:M28 family metallopeptidase [Sphingomonas naasensis]NIJ22124.1 Zn-dependent M28 family amino/carboxypeptidase [Sphingomonas naasensis]TGX42209.1 M20/M25/M40 family metallo-hydrolase [Sphingomonas naasensis]